MLLAVLVLSGCYSRGQTFLATESTQILALSKSDYPSSDTPYRIESGDFWLVHASEGQLFSIVPVSPEYRDDISVDSCRFVWVEASKRFADPCSGDEWELNGRLNLDHPTEFWSNRDLDQYAITVEDGIIYVHLDRKILGTAQIGQSPS